MAPFSQSVREAAERNQTLLCVGLDPDPALMPLKDVFEFNKAIVDATQDLVCAYKPNIAFYDGLGESGHRALRKTIDYIHRSDIPVKGDSKRGDVQSTAILHARALFDVWSFDACTVNPYGGHDAVQPFLDYSEKGVFVWCRSSNPDAGELQDLKVVSADGEEPRPFYEWVAIRASSWNAAGNVGLIVGAPYPHELKRVRDLCPDLPMLIPGIGAQSGSLELAVKNGTDAAGRNAIVNVSRSITYASSDRHGFQQAARDAASDVRDLMNWQLGIQGHPWESTVVSAARP